MITVNDLILILEQIRVEHGNITVLHKNECDSDYGYPRGKEYSDPHVETQLFDPEKRQVFPVLPSAKYHVVIS